MIQFTWHVPRDGYQWIEAKPIIDNHISSDTQRVLTAGFTLQWRSYNPLHDSPALFRTFGDLEPTESAVQDFASQYGALGIGQDILTPESKAAIGEQIELWTTEITVMWHTLRIWEALKTRDHKALDRWFHLEDHGDFATVVYTPDIPWPLGVSQWTTQFISEEIGNVLLSTPRSYTLRGGPTDMGIPSDSAGWALAYLRTQMNTRLDAQTAVRLQYLPDTMHGLPLGVHIVPKNLLGALWLQAARALEGNIPSQRCLQCKSWFQVPAKARRASTKYCSRGAECRHIVTDRWSTWPENPYDRHDSKTRS